jgi:hypothetical protein
MSLIGSLEDLGLGDILQIISLSQKSGVLSIRGEEREGTILLSDGLVRGAFLKDGPSDLRDLLVDAEFLSSEDFDRACEEARRQGTSVEQAIAESTSISGERIDSLRREAVEAAVIAMFRWRIGDFSFDVQADPEAGHAQLLLTTGINAQYLAMEGSRRDDESAHQASEEPAENGDDSEPSAHEMFGVVESAEPAVLETRESEEEDADDLEPEPEPEPVPTATDALAAAAAERAGTELEAQADVPDESRGVAADSLRDAPPLVVVDPDLVALEWIKQVLEGRFSRIHIFQRWDLGLNPIRQYLARAVTPMVLVRVGAPGDHLSGIRSASDFVGRLKSQQPRMHVMWLREDGGPLLEDRGVADGVVVCPNSLQLRNPRAELQREEIAAAMRGELAAELNRNLAKPGSSDVAPASATVGRASAQGLRRLTEAAALLSDASTRGEVLPLVIRFAGAVFDRVAMFMVRGDSVVGIAQQGLSLAGGPDDAGLREIEVPRDGCAWFRAVLASDTPIRSGPSDAGDRALAARLGRSTAEESYVASIESGGEVVALLYADNLRSRRPLGDTQELEVVLHHAGLALERAMLERALAEAERPSRS